MGVMSPGGFASMLPFELILLTKGSQIKSPTLGPLRVKNSGQEFLSRL